MYEGVKWRPVGRGQQHQIFPFPVLLLFLFAIAMIAQVNGSSELNFDNQNLKTIPVEQMCSMARSHLSNVVSLANNQIEQLEKNSFACLASALKIVVLRNNLISRLSDYAFSELGFVQVLLLDNNQLTAVPSIEALRPMKSLRHLNLADNRIESIEEEAFSESSANLVSLNLRGNPVHRLAASSLANLNQLRTLTLSQTALEGSLPSMRGLVELRYYHADRTSSLNSAPADLCKESRKLSSLDLSYNRIQGSLMNGTFINQTSLIDLYLGHNQLRTIEEHAFKALNHLQVLELNNNQLMFVHPRAFLPVRGSIRDLNLAHNQHLLAISSLGLDRLVSIKLFGNRQLRRLPQFRSANRLALTYAYHCCDYLQPESVAQDATSGQEEERAPLFWQLVVSLVVKLSNLGTRPSATSGARLEAPDNDTSELSDTVVWPIQTLDEPPPDLDLWQHQLPPMTGNSTTPELGLSEPTSKRRQRRQNGILLDELVFQLASTRKAHSVWLEFGQTGHRPPRHLANKTLPSEHQRIECLPEPNSFLPCQDLFDSWWLRLGIWCVFLLAFTGNILVIVVLTSVRQSSSTSALTSIMWLAHSKRHIDVPRFLVINLAIADLLMALYLGILAFVDLSTLSEFKVFAIKWQYSTGCKLAGFLGVLSSELSVFILAIITLERNYAITNAVHLNRRLSLQKAMVIMFLGYMLALAMAVMPLNGISDYRKFSICLPLDMDSSLSSHLYVISLVGLNTFSFLLLLGCYLRMYCAIRGSQAWNTNDLRIAKRMSVLVVTDFLCWMPIVVTATSAILGHHLIGPKGVKVLTIFILPLNSVANPFLYAITTKKFKRDLRTLRRSLRAIVSLDCIRENQNHSNEPKLLVGYHQYQHNLAMMNKRRQLTLKSDSNSPGAHTISQRRSERPILNRHLCSCQHKIFEASSRNGTHLQPRIILDSGLTHSFRKLASGDDSDEQPATVSARQSVSQAARYYVVTSEPIHTSQAGPKQDCLLAPSSCEPASHHQSVSLEENLSQSPNLQVQNYLSVEETQTNRPASVCGYHLSSSLAKQTTISGSYDPMHMATTLEPSRDKLSSSINRLLFSPIAKAWSSLQISLNSNFTHQGSQNPAGDVQLESSKSVTERLASQLDPPDNSNSIDDILLMSSPSKRILKISERRMSRSCELISQYNPVVRSPTSSANEPTTSQGEYDNDQRILLATISRIGASQRGVPAHDSQYGGKCTRCRSWSPALLGKLEDCIHQIRNRIPGFNVIRNEAGQHTEPPDRQAEEQSFEDVVGLVDEQEAEDNEDEFKEMGPIKWSQKRADVTNKYNLRRQSNYKMQHQSSANSDTLSWRTGGTVMTNMSVSFDSNSNIPVLGHRFNDPDIQSSSLDNDLVE